MCFPILDDLLVKDTVTGGRTTTQIDIAAAPRSGREEERMRRIIEQSVAQAFGVARGELQVTTRGKARVALARQISMYVSHVVCGQSLTDVGRVFARDRTTVAHACGVVEDRRDDPRFDYTLELLEGIVRALLRPRSLSRPHLS